MRKQDLENLMVVVTAKKEKYLVVDKQLLGEEYNMRIKDFNDDLTCGHEEDRIDKVYDKIDFLLDVEGIESDGELLWERKWVPDIGETYYIADGTFHDYYTNSYWYNTVTDNHRLDLGLVYETREGAIKHGKRIVEMIKAEKNKDK